MLGGLKVDPNQQSDAAAVRYAYQHGIKVISLSLAPDVATTPPTTNESYTELRTELANAYANGCTVVMAAGNYEQELPYNASIFTGAIMVGGVNPNNEFYNHSNFGSRVDMAAAGERISISSLNGSYNGLVIKQAEGTSYATPMVAGAAAIVRRELDAVGYTGLQKVESVRDILIFTSDIAFAHNRDYGDQQRPMSSGYDGDVGPIAFPKLRSLNASAAARLARQMAQTDLTYGVHQAILAYMPASDDYGQLKKTDQSIPNVQDWYDKNLLMTTHLPCGQIGAWCYNSALRHAFSANFFKNGKCATYSIYGAPYLYKANATSADFGSVNNQISPTYTTSGGSGNEATGWNGSATWTP